MNDFTIDAKEALRITNEFNRKDAEKQYGEIFDKYSDILIKIERLIKDNASAGRNSCKLEDIEEYKSFKSDYIGRYKITSYLLYKGFKVHVFNDEHTVMWL